MNQYVRDLLKCDKLLSSDIDKLEDDLSKYSEQEIEKAIIKWYKQKKKEPISAEKLELLIFHPVCDRKIKCPKSLSELYAIDCKLKNMGYNTCFVCKNRDKKHPQFIVPISDKLKKKHWKNQTIKYQSETKVVFLNKISVKFDVLYYLN